MGATSMTNDVVSFSMSGIFFLSLLFFFTYPTTSPRLQLSRNIPPTEGPLKPLTANEAVTIDGVLLLQFVKFLPFHWDSKFSKNWRGMRVLTSQAIRLPPSTPDMGAGGEILLASKFPPSLYSTPDGDNSARNPHNSPPYLPYR